MITIHDRQTATNRLPVVDLLLAVVRHANVRPDDRVALTRMGGAGECVWQLESKLDAGEIVSTSVAELLTIASKSSQIIDELRCTNEKITFGLFDATFLFVQAVDKDIENEIAAEFRSVTSLADQE